MNNASYPSQETKTPTLIGLTSNIMRWRHLIFVWGIWAGMVLAAVLLVQHYGHNVPYYDEWSLVYTLEGRHAIDLEWLWQPRNGHRIAVPKLALLAIHTLTGWDFRASMYASVILLGLASAALIWAASRSRGSLSYADAIFPLLLLNWGHYDNMLWGWQLSQVLPIAVAALLLSAVVRWRLSPPFPVAALAALGVVTLPLSGVPGLACTPGFALWLLELGRRRWLSGSAKAKQEAIVLWGITSLALLLVVAYFVGLRNPGIPSPSLIISARALLAFLAHSFAFAAEALRPWSFLMVIPLFATAIIWLLQALRAGGRRAHALALLFALIAFAGLAISVGVARPATTFPHRYFLFAVPALFWVYLTADLVRKQSVAQSWRALLLALSLAAAVYNTSIGLQHASARSIAMSAFEADIRAGLPPSQLIARHQRTLLPFPEDGGAYWHDSLAFSFEVLREAGIGAFTALAAEAGFQEVNIAELAEPSFTKDPQAPFLGWIWQFAEAQPLAGVRITQPHQSMDGEEMTLEWTRSLAEPFSKERRYVHWWMTHEGSATVWIYDTVKTLRLTAPVNGMASSAPELRLLLPGD